MANTIECLQQIRELITACSLPPLKEDLDEVHLESEQFDSFRKSLEMQLTILFDLLQQNKQYIFESKEQKANEILANLLVLLCEIAAPSTVYRLLNESLQRNVKRILQEQMPVDNKAVEMLVLSLYQEKVGKTAWRKQLAALHGFPKFLEEQFAKGTLPKQWINFCLSVGLIVRDSHDPTCKRIGISIFNMILNSGDFLYVQQQNIHSVIYDSAYKDVDFADTVEAATDIWKCLYKCLDFFKELDSSNWSHSDDLMEKALKNVTMAPNNFLSLCNLQFVTNFGLYFAINRREIEAHCNANLNNPLELKQCQNTSAKNNSYIVFRWAKNVLNMFIDNSYKLMGDKVITMEFLKEMHKCYLVCITPIQLEIIRPHLLPFLEKFTAVLVQTIVTHKYDPEIIKLVSSILETFKSQLQHSSNSLELTDYHKMYTVLSQLLQHSLFLQNK